MRKILDNVGASMGDEEKSLKRVRFPGSNVRGLMTEKGVGASSVTRTAPAIQ